jgi:ankyrin repeat/BTB/POZ domain-containing protein 1
LSAYSDVTFEIGEAGRLFKAHKCVLAARSAYFREKFESKWKMRDHVCAKNEELVPEAFESMIKYMYTGHFSTLKVHFKSCVRLVKLFRLDQLMDQFKSKLSLLLQETLTSTTTAAKDPIGLTLNDTDNFLIGKFGANSKVTNTIVLEADAASRDQISRDFDGLLRSGLPDNNNNNNNKQIASDLCFNVMNCKIYVHKAFVCERSDYFKAFLNDPFNEIIVSNSVTPEIIVKSVSSHVLLQVFFFIYTNNFSERLNDENLIYDILQTADLYLLPGLKVNKAITN